MTKKECPIGLMCELMECRPLICSEYAKPWPLPYELEHWDKELKRWTTGYLQVSIPPYDLTDENEEHLIIYQQYFNNWIERIRIELFAGGWWDAIELPYTVENEALIVIENLRLDQDIAFSCPVSIRISCWEGFFIAVPIEKAKKWFIWFNVRATELDKYGFWKCHLIDYEDICHLD